jgi:hypothetical protein
MVIDVVVIIVGLVALGVPLPLFLYPGGEFTRKVTESVTT